MHQDTHSERLEALKFAIAFHQGCLNLTSVVPTDDDVLSTATKFDNFVEKGTWVKSESKAVQEAAPNEPTDDGGQASAPVDGAEAAN